MAHHVHVHVHIGNQGTKMAASTKKTTSKSTGKKTSRKGKRTPPRPKRLGNLKGGLRAYWAARGVKP